MQSADWLNVTLHSVGDAVIVTDTETRVTFMNPVAETLTGWKADEATGQPLDAVFNIVNQEKHPTLESPIDKALREGRVVGLANHSVLIAKDGSERPIDDSAAPLRNEASNIIGAVLVFRDVTERHRVEQLEDELRKRTEQLAEAEARIRSVVNNVINGVITIDEQGVVESFNSAAERLFGYKDEEVVGQNVRILMGEPHQGEHDSYLANYKRTGQAKIIGIGREVEGCRKDGSRFSMDLGISEFLRGERHYFTAVVRDNTERNRLADELRRVAADLSEADRRKDEFLAMLSHELRNPMAPMFNALQLIVQDGHETELQQEARGVIERQVRHLSRLTDDLLEVSRITTGSISLHTERVDVNGIVNGAVERLRPNIDRRQQALTITLAEGVIWLEADASRLEQVIGNLLNNASKYNNPGGRIWLTVASQDHHAIIRVRDDGIGMAPDLLPDIFDLFTQADKSLDRTEGGLGIGLALVKSLVELHRGTVTVDSQGIGKGSEFTVRLPVATDGQVRYDSSAKQATSTATDSLRVLVVDDSVDAAKMCSMLLRSWGHEARMAHNGPDALQQATGFHPHVILCDIGLPHMDGYEVARHIRQNPHLEGVMLVAVTGYGQDTDRQRSKEAGFDLHMVKPVESADLKELLVGIHHPQT